jgi:hypothetical protein
MSRSATLLKISSRRVVAFVCLFWEIRLSGQACNRAKCSEENEKAKRGQ